ncbi:MAG: adenylate/guanylate cyclase domain-containing protein [Leptospira sp.]|nr:adenylate/guanylate cyclase domain-containing protein [Leptospira sp.]
MLLYQKLKSFFSFYHAIPASAMFLLKEEEIHGAAMANKFRYVAGIGLLISAIVNISMESGIKGILVNFGAILIYFANTIIHRQILKSENLKLKSKYEYVSLFVDNTLIAMTIWNWYLLEGNGNPNFLVKNPMYYYFMIPISFALIQFRIQLVICSLLFFLLYFYIFSIYAFACGVEATVSWYEYILGSGVIISDSLVARPIAYVCLAIAVCYGIYRSYVMLIRLANVEAQKTSLSRYFSPDLIDVITSQPNVIEFGKRQKVTVLFSDIRDFTHFSEGMDTTSLSKFLTEYRKRMTRAVFANSGTLDKFIGDAVMATFGTPIPSDISGLDSINAVKSAKQMLVELSSFNADREKVGETPIKIGIGIHTGEVFAGNIGSEERMEYTVIGDTVNTASRIESACKPLNAVLLISEDVWNEIGKPNDFVRTQKIQLAGKENLVELFKWIV